MGCFGVDDVGICLSFGICWWVLDCWSWIFFWGVKWLKEKILMEGSIVNWWGLFICWRGCVLVGGVWVVRIESGRWVVVWFEWFVLELVWFCWGMFGILFEGGSVVWFYVVCVSEDSRVVVVWIRFWDFMLMILLLCMFSWFWVCLEEFVVFEYFFWGGCLSFFGCSVCWFWEWFFFWLCFDC